MDLPALIYSLIALSPMTSNSLEELDFFLNEPLFFFHFKSSQIKGFISLAQQNRIIGHIKTHKKIKLTIASEAMTTNRLSYARR